MTVAAVPESPGTAPDTQTASRTARLAARAGWRARLERATGVRTIGFGVAGFAVVAWLMAYWLGGRGLYLLAYAALLVLAAAVVISRRSRPVEAERSRLPRRIRVGQSVGVELILSSPRRLGMFSLEEHLPEQLGDTVRVSIDRVTPSDPWHYQYILRPRLRGVYSVGPLVAIWSDTLGLAQSQQTLLEPTEILVHPTVDPMLDRPLTRQLEDPPIRPPKTKPWPTGFEFYGMRDYVPGDDLRRVVWKAVARTGRMLVRESEQGVTDQVNIILDTDPEWHQPGLPSATFETAVNIAASVGAQHIKNGFSVTLVGNEKNLCESLRGPRARLLLLDELARVQMGSQPLSSALERLLGRRGRGAHNVLITPHLDRKAASRAALLTGRGASVRVILVSAEETDQASVHRATEIGAEVTSIQARAVLGVAAGHAVGAGLR